MADHIIEVVIKTSLEGAEIPDAYKKQLADLSKQGITTSDALSHVTEACKDLNAQLGNTEASRAFTQGIIAGAKQGALEFDKAAQSITADNNQIAQSSKASGAAIQTTAQQATAGARAHANLGAAASVLNNRSLGLARTLGFAATALGDLGPAGQIASNALFHVAISGAALLSGIGLLSAGIGIFTTVLALFISHLQETAKKKEELDTAMRTGDIGFFVKQVQDADKALEGLNRKLEATKDLQQGAAAGQPGTGEEQFLQFQQGRLTAQQTKLQNDRAEALRRATELTRNEVAKSILTLDAQTAAIGKSVAEAEEYNHQMRVATALQGELKTVVEATRSADEATRKTAEGIVAAFTEASEAQRDARTSDALKQLTLSQQAAVDASKKQLADVAAAGKQLVFETTGDLAALEAAFAQRRSSIIAASQADLNRQLTANKEPSLRPGIITAASQQQAAAVQALEQERQKALFSERQKAIQLESGLQSSILNQISAQVEVERRRLGVMKDQGASLADQAEQENKVFEFERDRNDKAVEVLEKEKTRLVNLQVAGNLEKQRLIDLQNVEDQLIKELDTRNAINDAITKGDQTRLNLSVARNIKSRGAEFDAAAEADNARLDLLKNQVEVLKQQGKPYDEILTVTGQIDELEKSILRTQIEKKKLQIDELRGKTGTEAATSGELELAEAQLARLESALGIAGHGRDKLNADIHAQAEAMASSLAGNFVDNFVTFLSTKDAKLSDVFASLGKSLVSQFLQSMIAGLLARPFEEILRQWSSTGGSGGGGLLGGILGLLGKGLSFLGLGFGVPTGYGAAPPGVEGPSLPGGFFSTPQYAHGGYILPPNYAFAHGGYVVPRGLLKPFASGGTVTRGPVVGMVGEEGPELVARMKPAGAGDNWPSGGGQATQVIINGDITPRRPDMKPEDIIQIISADAYKGGKTSKAMTNIVKRLR